MEARHCLMNREIDQLEWTFKALAYRKRLEIIVLLLEHGWLTVGEISRYTEATLCTISRNLAVLARMGVIASRKRGKHALYGIRKARCSPSNRVLLALIRQATKPKRTRELERAIATDLLSGTYKHTLALLHKTTGKQ